jgi:hypothetical protein
MKCDVSPPVTGYLYSSGNIVLPLVYRDSNDFSLSVIDCVLRLLTKPVSFSLLRLCTASFFSCSQDKPPVCFFHGFRLEQRSTVHFRKLHENEYTVYTAVSEFLRPFLELCKFAIKIEFILRDNHLLNIN